MAYSPLQLAEAFIQTGELADALDALTQHLDSVPEDDAAQRLRAGVSLRLPGDESLRAALADLAQIRQPNASDWLQRSIVLERLADLPGALAAAQQACALDPDDERLIERRLHLLLQTGDLDEAEALLAGLPVTWRWAQWRGDVHGQRGAAAEAADAYSTALNLLADAFPPESRWADALRARLLLARADTLRRLEQWDDADADYAAAEILVPDDPMIAFNRGIIAARRGDLDTARIICQAAWDAAGEILREQMRRLLAANPGLEQRLAIGG